MFGIICILAAASVIGTNAAILHPNCPPGGWNGMNVMLPVENCSEYIQCDNYGLGHLKSCAPSDPALVFEPSLRMCTWPWLTSRQECQKQKPRMLSSDEQPIVENRMNICKEYTTVEPYPGCPQVTLPPGADTILLEVDGECDKFAQCDNDGIAHIKCCAQSDPLEPMLIFDKSFGKCVWKSQSNRNCDVNP